MSFYKWAMGHGYSADLQIDRINYDKGYSPSNCRFVDVVTQANNRSNNRVIEYKGKRMTVAQWSRELGVDYKKLARATQRGIPMEEYDPSV